VNAHLRSSDVAMCSRSFRRAHDRKPNRRLKSLPVANYSAALAKAVEWLGDRYLLAIPINSAHRSRVDQPALGSNARAAEQDDWNLSRTLGEVAEPRTLNFAAKRNGGICCEHTNANE